MESTVPVSEYHLNMDENLNNGDESKNIHFKASTNALEFLKTISDEDINLCMFDDELVSISEDGKSVGEYKIQISKTTVAGEELLLIHASSQGKLDDTPMGTTITCHIRRKDLMVVSQSYQEYLKIPQNELEKNTSMKLDMDGSMFVTRLVRKGNDVKKHEHTFNEEETNGLITEGSSILLQRLLAKKGIQEEMVFLTIDNDSGKITPTVYKPLPERSQTVGNTDIEVVGIERSMMSATELPYTWQSYYLDDGHLTMRIQVGSPIIVVVERVPQKIEPEIIEPKPVFGKKPLNWEEDAEMYSKFLHRKDELKADHQSYVRSHPDIKALLSDYFQYLLLHKPDDVIPFTADYFATFSAMAPDAPPHKQSNTLE